MAFCLLFEKSKVVLVLIRYRLAKRIKVLRYLSSSLTNDLSSVQFLRGWNKIGLLAKKLLSYSCHVFYYHRSRSYILRSSELSISWFANPSDRKRGGRVNSANQQVMHVLHVLWVRHWNGPLAFVFIDGDEFLMSWILKQAVLEYGFLNGGVVKHRVLQELIHISAGLWELWLHLALCIFVSGFLEMNLISFR